MSNFQSLKEILLAKPQTDSNSAKYISREFQDYGCRLAEELHDDKYKSLYIKLAKENPRPVLEKAKSYVLDYPDAKNKGALFMWKLKELTGKNLIVKKKAKKKKPSPEIPLFKN